MEQEFGMRGCNPIGSGLGGEDMRGHLGKDRVGYPAKELVRAITGRRC
jgi:hypothetical protein